MRSAAEKTDLGRLATPSILSLVDEAMGISRPGSHLSGRTSTDIWEALERMLEVSLVCTLMKQYEWNLVKLLIGGSWCREGLLHFQSQVNLAAL